MRNDRIREMVNMKHTHNRRNKTMTVVTWFWARVCEKIGGRLPRIIMEWIARKTKQRKSQTIMGRGN